MTVHYESADNFCEYDIDVFEKEGRLVAESEYGDGKQHWKP